MRPISRVSTLLAILLISAATAAKHAAEPPQRGTAAAPARASLAGGDGGRRRNSAAFMCDRYEEQPKSVVLRAHRIVRGDSLSGIAALYGTSVRALAAANGLRSDAVIRTGQELVIPQQARPGGGDDWLKYARSPEHPGRLELSTYRSHFSGPVVANGRLLAGARDDISTLLGAKVSGRSVPDRLIRLLARVSDTFGSRPIRVVSGYRTTSYFADSRHKDGAAVDFSIPGVPNAALREYLLLFDDVGVGYYPNSSFVHLDVRGCAMQWVDYAGPGEAPRLRPSMPRFATAHSPLARKVSDAPSVSELDEIAEGVAAAMDEAAPRAGRTDEPHSSRGSTFDEPTTAPALEPDGHAE
jgi:LysM repeat protein